MSCFYQVTPKASLIFMKKSFICNLRRLQINSNYFTFSSTFRYLFYCESALPYAAIIISENLYHAFKHIGTLHAEWLSGSLNYISFNARVPA
jgi:hypothetical protein